MKVKDALIRYALLITGAILAAFSIENLLVPCKILDGGIVGVSIIISTLTKLPLSILTLVLNIPFVIIGGKRLGKQFWLRTGIAMALFSTFLELFKHWDFEATEDPLLATVFGGIILGAGVGLIIKNGGCLDGTETVAIMLSKKLSMSVGQIVLGFNIIIYACAGILFGIDRALYSLLTYFIVSKVVDYIDIGLNQAKAVMIITNEGQQIAADIYETLGRTVTFMNGEGLISGEKTILYCVITRMELQPLRKIIEKDDYSAFMTISDVNEIIGSHIKSSEYLE